MDSLQGLCLRFNVFDGCDFPTTLGFSKLFLPEKVILWTLNLLMYLHFIQYLSFRSNIAKISHKRQICPENSSGNKKQSWKKYVIIHAFSRITLFSKGAVGGDPGAPPLRFFVSVAWTVWDRAMQLLDFETLAGPLSHC